MLKLKFSGAIELSFRNAAMNLTNTCFHSKNKEVLHLRDVGLLFLIQRLKILPCCFLHKIEHTLDKFRWIP